MKLRYLPLIARGSEYAPMYNMVISCVQSYLTVYVHRVICEMNTEIHNICSHIIQLAGPNKEVVRCLVVDDT